VQRRLAILVRHVRADTSGDEAFANLREIARRRVVKERATKVDELDLRLADEVLRGVHQLGGIDAALPHAEHNGCLSSIVRHVGVDLPLEAFSDNCFVAPSRGDGEERVPLRVLRLNGVLDIR